LLTQKLISFTAAIANLATAQEEEAAEEEEEEAEEKSEEVRLNFLRTFLQLTIHNTVNYQHFANARAQQQ
jgi:hypothetical protein